MKGRLQKKATPDYDEAPVGKNGFLWQAARK